VKQALLKEIATTYDDEISTTKIDFQFRAFTFAVDIALTVSNNTHLTCFIRTRINLANSTNKHYLSSNASEVNSKTMPWRIRAKFTGHAGMILPTIRFW